MSIQILTARDTLHAGNHWLANDSVFLKSISSADTSAAQNEASNKIDFFKGHELKPLHNKAITVQHPNQDWLFIVVVLLLGIVAYIRTFYTKYLREIISACFNYHLINQLFRDENLVIQRTLLFLQINFALTVSLLLYILSARYGWTLGTNETFIRYVIIVLIVSSAVFLKFVVLKICGFLFRQENEIALYRFNISIISGVSSLIFLPFAAVMLFASSISFDLLVYFVIAIGAIAYSYRIFRGIRIGLGYVSYSPLYLFLYLCALEIAPLLIFIKLIKMQA